MVEIAARAAGPVRQIGRSSWMRRWFSKKVTKVEAGNSTSWRRGVDQIAAAMGYDGNCRGSVGEAVFGQIAADGAGQPGARIAIGHAAAVEPHYLRQHAQEGWREGVARLGENRPVGLAAPFQAAFVERQAKTHAAFVRRTPRWAKRRVRSG